MRGVTTEKKKNEQSDFHICTFAYQREKIACLFKMWLGFRDKFERGRRVEGEQIVLWVNFWVKIYEKFVP